MQQRVLAIISAGMAVMSLCVSPRTLRGQSAPPGQVSHRMTSAPPSAKDTVQPVLSLDKLTAELPVAKPEMPSIKDALVNNLTRSLAATGATAVEDPCEGIAAYSVELDQCQAMHALGSVKKAVWEKVVTIDNQVPAASDRTLLAARNLAMQFEDTTDLPTAESLIGRQERLVKVATTQDQDAVAAVQQIKRAIKGLSCSTTVLSNASGDAEAKPQFKYGYRVVFPTFGKSCSGDAIKSYFNAGDPTVEAANQVKYLYNAQQSASQFGADMLTATFPGFQAVLAGRATAGSGQAATGGTTPTTGTTATIAGMARPFATTTATTTGTATTDSVATAVSKIENGGDFNVRFPVPLLYYTHGSYSISSGTHPNVGFNIDKFSGQSTITQSTEYGLNVPFETYMQTKSLDVDANGISNAVLFLDLQPSAEVISSALATKIGLTGSRAFFLGQASAGIQFSNSIGLSLQYFYGPKQLYSSTDTSGTATMTNSRIQGFHLAVSFSPQKKSK